MRPIWIFIRHSQCATNRKCTCGHMFLASLRLPGALYSVPGLTTLIPQVLAEERIERTARGLLLRGLQRQDSGVYLCAAVEHGFSQPIRRLALHVLSATQAERLARAEEAAPPAPLGPKLWYRDFLQLVEPGGGGGPNSLRMCRPQHELRVPGPESRRKSRNRRTHASYPRADRGPRSAGHW